MSGAQGDAGPVARGLSRRGLPQVSGSPHPDLPAVADRLPRRPEHGLRDV